MTKEDKKLLLQDLCARLPYNVKVNHLLDTKPSDLFAIDTYRNTLYCFRNGREEWYKVEFIKPYLRPMSSVTEEEEKQFQDDELPEHNEEDNGLISYPTVLVCLYDGFRTEDYYDDISGEWRDFDGDVEYWMPMPQPPRKEDKK